MAVSPTNDDPTQDQRIGRTVAAWRGDRSQKALADEMRVRGHKWSQSTVWSVERGDRPLRLTEARDLCAIIESWRGSSFRVQHLLDPVAAHSYVALRESFAAKGELVQAMIAYWTARADAAGELRELVQDAEAGLPTHTSPFLEHRFKDILGQDGELQAVANEARERWIRTPLAGNETELPEDAYASMSRLVDERLASPGDTWAAWLKFSKLFSPDGSHDGEHQ